MSLELRFYLLKRKFVNCLFLIVIRIVKGRHLPGYRGSEMGLVFSSVPAVSTAGLCKSGQPGAVLIDE